MMLIHRITELQIYLARQSSIAFVPTMGNLHEGHIDLVRQAQKHGSCVVVSIFVNPLQFGPAEDFAQYPRTLEADCSKLSGLADVVFAPSVAEMYPQSQTVFIDPPPIANELCGAARPSHFRGMATVVLKLLNIVQPQTALFGKKDFQQLQIIRQMVVQLNLPVNIIGCPTVRAEDDLALSSRNQYLSEQERGEATFLYKTLAWVSDQLVGGHHKFNALESAASARLTARGWQVDYVAIRSPDGLLLPTQDDRHLVILGAARLGRTRLIDNVEVCLSPPSPYNARAN